MKMKIKRKKKKEQNEEKDEIINNNIINNNNKEKNDEDDDMENKLKSLEEIRKERRVKIMIIYVKEIKKFLY